MYTLKLKYNNQGLDFSQVCHHQMVRNIIKIITICDDIIVFDSLIVQLLKVFVHGNIFDRSSAYTDNG
jgi:hypothetical protein